MKSGSYSRHADEPGLDSCYAGFQSITPPSTQCCFSPPDQEAGDDDDGNGRDLAQSTTSPNTQSPLSEDNLLDSMEPATTESTPEPSPKTPGNPYCHHLINQTIGDFIHETYEMLERFSFNDLSLETHKTMLESIKRRLNHGHMLNRNQHHDQRGLTARNTFHSWIPGKDHDIKVRFSLPYQSWTLLVGTHLKYNYLKTRCTVDILPKTQPKQ